MIIHMSEKIHEDIKDGVRWQRRAVVMVKEIERMRERTRGKRQSEIF